MTKPPFSLMRIGDRTLVACAGAATLMAFVFLGSQIATITSGRAEGARDAGAIQRLQIEIARMDLRRMQTLAELLETGDADAARIYREIDAAQSNALLQLASEATIPQEEAAASAASFAYHSMATYESDAVAFVLSGRGSRAQETLATIEYADARAAFGEALAKSREALWPRLDPVDAKINRATMSTMVFGPLATVFVLALLALVLGRLSRLADRARHAEMELATASAEIARREREAHANMIARCPAPAAEFEFAPGLKLVAWLRKRGVEDLERWLKVYPGEIRKLAPQFAVLRVNKPAADLLKAADGGQLRELERWLPDRSLHKCVLAILRALWNRSSAVAATIDVRTFDGEERTMELRGTLIAKGEGKPPTLMTCLTDVTDIATARGEFDVFRETANKRSEYLEEFFTTVSRELRAALDGVTGMAATLDRSRLDRDQRDALAVIKDSGEAMRETLDRARDFRRLEAGDIEIANQPFDVGLLVQAVNARYSSRAKAKGLRLRMSIEDAARIRMAGDENRIRLILSKLVGNAIEFTPNGEVEARITRDQTPEGRDLLVLTVRDTGGGLSASDIKRALEDSAGSGGGLALCRRLCTAMGGRLDITSSSDYGTTVTAFVRVDEAPAEDADAAEPDTLGEGAGRRLTLLAADDNAINRIVLNDMLEPLGVDLTLVDNGADAIAAWRSRAFDVILLDIHMPVLSGHDVAREIRKIEAQEGRAPTPIIAVSASVMKSEVEACIAAGMDDHVPKPIELNRLRAAIAKAIAASDAAREAAA